MLKIGSSPLPGSATAATHHLLETRMARLTFRVDLAPIEFAALLLIAEDFVSPVDFGEALLRLRLFALIGMEFLGELPIGRFDFRRARRLGEPEHFIRIAHE